MPIDVDSDHIEEHVQSVQLVNWMGRNYHRHGRHSILERTTAHGGFHPGLISATAARTSTAAAARLLLGKGHLVLINLLAKGSMSLYDVGRIAPNCWSSRTSRIGGRRQRIISTGCIAAALEPGWSFLRQSNQGNLVRTIRRRRRRCCCAIRR